MSQVYYPLSGSIWSNQSKSSIINPGGQTSATAYKDGLEDIIAARSAICRVDGEAGRLYYRGYEIADLAGAASFEDATRLFWVGELPSPAERAEFGARLGETRPLPPPVLDLLRRLPRECHPLDALRTAVSLAAASDPDVRSDEPAANLRKAYRLINLVPATVAAWQRIRTGREPVAARADGSHAANFLYMLDGREPSAEVARVLDVILTLHADHEFNASTFAARVAVATVADMHSAVVAAIATLKGPRHGGANEDVLAMLLEIAEPERAEAFVEARIGARAALSKRDRPIPSRACPASAIASTRWTTRGRGCCAAWPSPWRRPPGAASSSRSRSGSTTR